jgi:uncharacterized protein YfbU (UPF0304 family)
MTNVDKYKKDLESLIRQGDMLFNAIQYECYPDQFEKQARETLKTADAYKEFISTIPSFRASYQSWYSETLVVIKQILPDRLLDFISYYEVPKNRKELKFVNYMIADYLQNLRTTNFVGEVLVDGTAAINKFQQQLEILRSAQRRFDSSLFEIKQMVQADLFDDELAAAKMLNKNKFMRAAGAVAGVILEKHLKQVLKNHNLTCKKDTISPLNDALKAGNVYDIPTFRKIQYLADIRNQCDHDSKREPTQEEVEEMVNGVRFIVTNVF